MDKLCFVCVSPEPFTMKQAQGYTLLKKKATGCCKCVHILRCVISVKKGKTAISQGYTTCNHNYPQTVTHTWMHINPAPLTVNSKHFKAKAKVQESSSGLSCLWKQSKKFCFPQTLLFPVSLPDANWQTEGKNEINNHTNKGEDDVKQPEDKEKSKRKRKRENGSITHQRSFIISWGTR